MIEFKHDVDPKDLELMQPALWIILTRTVLYCNEYNLPCRITSLISDRNNIVTRSKTHEQGRAFDLGIQGWTVLDINRYRFMINRDYSDIGAISSSDLKVRAAVVEKDHIHLQVRPDADYYKFV